MWRTLFLASLIGLASDPGPATPHAEPAPSAQTERPSCNRETLGLMWPALANDDPALAKRFAREGQLEVCRWGPWRFSWASPTVHIRQLREAAIKRKGVR